LVLVINYVTISDFISSLRVSLEGIQNLSRKPCRNCRLSFKRCYGQARKMNTCPTVVLKNNCKAAFANIAYGSWVVFTSQVGESLVPLGGRIKIALG
jgi:hypothetical protein